MHTTTLRGLVLGLLIAVLAACSSVDTPAANSSAAIEEGIDTPLPISEMDNTASNEEQNDVEEGALETLQSRKFSGKQTPNRGLTAPPNGACFYSSTNFRGARLCFTADTSVPVGFISGFTSIRSSWNDRVSSVVVAEGYELIMYTDADFEGRASVAGLPDRASAIREVRYNNTLSSFKIVRKN